jgi:hypothetical protein
MKRPRRAVLRIARGRGVTGNFHCRASNTADLPWLLLGVHSARFDVGSKEPGADGAPGLNRAWYADILLKPTESRLAPARRSQIPDAIWLAGTPIAEFKPVGRKILRSTRDAKAGTLHRLSKEFRFSSGLLRPAAAHRGSAS